ncbi:MAG: YihY family inner membrane protein [Thermoanaerobaculales bacterium]|nr:YihY family inner membrane protein [Thermoanaerobaculales bacterium]
MLRSVQFMVSLWEQLNRDKVIIRASGLAYSSLLATVPLTAVVFALLSGFGALDELKLKLRGFLLANILPTRQDEIAVLIDQAIGNTARIGLLGFIFLILAVILLLDNVENSFNDIYHVSSRRRIVSKVTAYTSVLVLGTLLIGASLSLSARFDILALTGGRVDPTRFSHLMSWVFPLSLAFLAFLVAFTVVPYTRVRIASAVLGAAVSAGLFELAKQVFSDSVGQSVRYSTLYGSLAIVPIFLIWLYISWVVVLLGLEVAFTHQHFMTLLRSRAIRGGPESDRVVTGLRLFALVAERFETGEDPPTIDQLSRRLLVPLGSVESRVDRLAAVGLVRRVALGSDTEGVVPARPTGTVMVSEVIAAFEPQLVDPGPDRPVEEAVNQTVREFLAAGHERVGELTLSELLARARAHAGS